MKANIAMLALGLVACAPANKTDDSADTSTGIAAIDTLKPAAGATTASSDSLTAPVSGVNATPATATKQAATGTKTVSPRDTTNIGRDRALPINTKDPKVYLPTVDTGKKRPPR